MRVVDPKATILVFSTGKMVVTGLREAAQAEGVVAIVIKNLKQAKVAITAEPVITIQNIVASDDLHVPVDLNEASILMENAMYEPEVFPGLIYRMQEPKTGSCSGMIYGRHVLLALSGSPLLLPCL